jgi:L-fucose dehydrogenase
MDLHLKEKVVIVTGGAKGIGAAIVRACAAEGAIPVIIGRDEEAGRQLQTDLQNGGSTCGLISIELGSSESCFQSVQQTLQKFGRIDALVNNAGRNDKVGLEEGTVDEYVASLRHNLVHYYGMAHYALPQLKRSRGAIVNIGSKTAVTGQGSTSGYASSKGAIMALTREWAVDLLPYGIRVNTVIPAEVMTENDPCEDSLRKADDNFGGDCCDGGISALIEIQPHHGAAFIRRRRLCTSGSRPDVRIIE